MTVLFSIRALRVILLYRHYTSADDYRLRTHVHSSRFILVFVLTYNSSIYKTPFLNPRKQTS